MLLFAQMLKGATQPKLGIETNASLQYNFLKKAGENT